MRYLILSQLVLALLWVFYEFALRNDNQHGIKRIYILCSLFTAVLFPFINWNATIPATSGVAIELPAISLSAEGSVASGTFTFLHGLFVAYVVGALAMFIYVISGVVRLLIWRRRALAIEGTLNQVWASPSGQNFSWFNWIFINTQLDADARDIIILHERMHSRLGHSFDLILVSLFKVAFWFNPIVWIFQKRLVEVHEHQADSAVLYSIDKQDYQELLAANAMGVSAHILAHEFNHYSLLKNRLDMLNKRTNRPIQLFKYLFLIPVGAVLVFIASCTEENDSMTSNEPTQKEAPAPTAEYDEPAEFIGGQEAMMQYLTAEFTYPEKAKQEKAEGQAIVGFVINTTGAIEQVKIKKSAGHELLDQEAVRVVEQMPKWKPASKDGAALKTEMYLPINFKLPVEEELEESNDTERG